MPVIPPTKPYRIGRSKTGLGLFATKPIKKGTKIVRYFGPLLDSKKAEEDAIENKYLFELDKRWTIDGSVRENVARYINHSCKPNAESDVKPRKKKIFIRAIKDIEPGEEINYDYGTDYFKAYLKPIGCRCEPCEKKRAKKKADARAERVGLKPKDGRKPKRKTEKLAKDKAKQRAKAKAKMEGEATARGKAKSRRPASAAGKRVKSKTAAAKTLSGGARAA
ncbi:SET domain-containing protein [Bradyrhizobium ontarionense]|uniref:SET domain-containing protein n=1 Tax=Bradyrhizobium ontarionense TaxID=2898149 RepID=A0ABY3RB19_9BRAD|nr:SET domain-containing protein [Bradyrhizobium sp. A19]UFZ04570.1 SET domain-containing protein [Bradyrhizobium sp. A19]